jgi:Tfp pilus assembly protein FimT
VVTSFRDDGGGGFLAFMSAMANKESGFSAIELVAVIATIVTMAAIAIPQIYISLNDYRLHSDASETAGYLNVERMRAASQNAPYSLDVTATTYAIEQLTPLTYNPLALPTTSTYTSQNPIVYDFGTQYFSTGNTVTNCRAQVQGVTVYPIPVMADPSSCGTPFQVYFNTRGLPVNNTGGALTSTGGVAVYLTNTNGMVDAVTVSAGGAVQVWNWNLSTSTWALR